MTTISKINATIIDHGVATSSVAVCLIIFGVLALNTVAYQNNATKANDNLLQPFAATQAPANEVSASRVHTSTTISGTTLTISKSTPLSLQNQPQGVASELQPARAATLDTTASVSNVQPSANTMQLTGVNLQNASAAIQ